MADRSWQENRRRRMRFRLAAVLVALTVASLFTAGWMINQAVIGNAEVGDANKASMAQELAQVPGNSPAPSTENKDADSFSAYGSPKDPFNPVLKKKSASGSPSGSGGAGGGVIGGTGATGTGTSAGAGGAGRGPRNRGGTVITNPPGNITIPGGTGSTSPGSGSPSGRGSRLNPGGTSPGGNIPGGVRRRGGDRFDTGRSAGRGTGGGTTPGAGGGRGSGAGAGGTQGQLPNTGGVLPDTGGELPDTGGVVLPPDAPLPNDYNNYN